MVNKTILGICGSPRKQSTEHVLSEALNMMEEKGYETELFTVRGKDIGPCRNCDYCIRKKECIQKDDMSELYPLFKDVQGIIMATPIYNGGVSAQIKAVMDRTRAAAAVDIDFLKTQSRNGNFSRWRSIWRPGTGHTADNDFLHPKRSHTSKWRAIWIQSGSKLLVSRLT